MSYDGVIHVAPLLIRRAAGAAPYATRADIDMPVDIAAYALIRRRVGLPPLR